MIFASIVKLFRKFLVDSPVKTVTIEHVNFLAFIFPLSLLFFFFFLPTRAEETASPLEG